MIDAGFLEKILCAISNDNFLLNTELKKEIQDLHLKVKDKDEVESKVLLLTMKYIDCKYREAYDMAIQIYREKENELNLPCILLVDYYIVFLSIRLNISKEIEINQQDLPGYSKPLKILSEKLAKDGSFRKYLWLPEFLEGFLYYEFDTKIAITRLNQSIELAYNYKYKDMPVSLVYDKLGLLYYEIGYFDEALEIYEKAYKNKIWKTSTYILNNRAFLLAILKDNRALEALEEVIDNSDDTDPYPRFNLACYKLSVNEDTDAVQSNLKLAFQGFIKEFKKRKDKSVLFNAFSCAVLVKIAMENLVDVCDEESEITLDQHENNVSKKLLLNLLCDVENFLTTTYRIKSKLSQFLEDRKTIIDDVLIILKRWSSYSPLIPNKEHQSLGGGHFFTWKGKGFVVDPGPYFLDNFSENGFKLADIDCIICSHGHVDHTQDIERIVTLLYEKNSINTRKQKIRFLFSPGNASKYGSLLSASKDVIESGVVLYPDKKIYINDLEISVTSTLSNHKELFSRPDNALSFIIDLLDNQEKKYSIGFTNDTGFTGKYNKTIEKFFCEIELDILIANIGSIAFSRLINLTKLTMVENWWNNKMKKSTDILSEISSQEFLDTFGYRKYEAFEQHYLNGNFSKKYEWYKTHLGFRGIFRLASKAKYKYMIISEFGEELKPFRHKIALTINEYLKNDKQVLTGDIGTKFLLRDNKILPYCDYNKNYTDQRIVERVVKSQDYRIIHFEESILSDPIRLEDLKRTFRHLI